MSYLSDSRQPKGPGVLILRHKGHVKQGYAVDMRLGMLGAEVTGRQTGQGQLGHIVYKDDGIGDINHALLWPANINERATGAFSWAFPAISSPSQTSGGTRSLNAHPNDGLALTNQVRAPNGPNVYSGGKCRMSPMDEQEQSSETVLPIWVDPEKGVPIPDRRFTPIKPITVGECPKNPRGSPGIVLAASNEDQQYELFFPLGNSGRLVAVNQGGDWQMGSIVADTTPEHEIDPEKTARLQSMMWVVKPIPKVSDKCMIAWNISTSGCGDHQGGAVIQAGPITCGPLDASVALVNSAFGGPFDVGAGMGDKHMMGLTDPGVSELRHPVNPLHFATTTLWRDGAAKSDGKKAEESEDPDGPMDFEGTLEEEYQSGDYLTPCHLYWDKDAEHEGPSGKLKGKWKWYAEAKHTEDEDDEDPPEDKESPDPGDGPSPTPHEGPPKDEDERKPVETEGATDENKPETKERDYEQERYDEYLATQGTPPASGDNPTTPSDPVKPNPPPEITGDDPFGNKSAKGADDPLAAFREAANNSPNPPKKQSGNADPPPSAGDQKTGQTGTPTATDAERQMAAQQRMTAWQKEGRTDRNAAQERQQSMIESTEARRQAAAEQGNRMRTSLSETVPPTTRALVYAGSIHPIVDPSTGKTVYTNRSLLIVSNPYPARTSGRVTYP